MARDEQRPAEGRQGALQLLDGGQIEVIGRFIEHQKVDAQRLEDRELHTGSLPRRESPCATRHLQRAQAELGQQRARH